MKLTLANRRNFLRGTMAGTALSIGLPLLDCFFDGNGEALAATGKAPSPCFGTWFWGCGLTPGHWEPKTVGKGYAIPPLLEPLAAYKDKLNVYSGMNVHLDGRPNITHLTGVAAITTGTAPFTGSGLGIMGGDQATLDSVVADQIGLRTRFRSIEVTCTQKARDTYSSRGGNATNVSEVSPLELYTRLFGPEFIDPNAADFKPDARTIVRRSALSAVAEQRVALMKQLGATDRARAEDYFTSLRQLEQKLELELEKPEPMEACETPRQPEEVGRDVEIATTHRLQQLFGQLLAHALACGQTNVFNVVFSQSLSMLRRPGVSEGHHQRTHEEPSDPAIGFQTDVYWFNQQSMLGFATMVKALAGIQEGAGTLLDRSLILAMTDVSYAKNHTVANMPMLTAGGAGGRVKTGYHLSAPGETVSRVGLTIQQAMGIPLAEWGTESNKTARAFTEILA